MKSIFVPTAEPALDSPRAAAPRRLNSRSAQERVKYFSRPHTHTHTYGCIYILRIQRYDAMSAIDEE